MCATCDIYRAQTVTFLTAERTDVAHTGTCVRTKSRICHKNKSFEEVPVW